MNLKVCSSFNLQSLGLKVVFFTEATSLLRSLGGWVLIKKKRKEGVLYHLYKETGCRSGERNVALNYISQTPFEIYETTHGRNFPVGASNHFLTPTEGRISLKKQCKGPVYTQGPGT